MLSRNEDAGKPGSVRTGQSFWRTVFAVELTDIAFSIDSILAAVAMAKGLPPELDENVRVAIVVTGGILGIITMRFVAGYFIILLERYKGLEAGAYGLVAWIGLKLVTDGLHKAAVLPFDMNPWVFWSVMFLIVVVSLVYRPPSRPPLSAADNQVIEDVTRIAGGQDVSDQEEPGPMVEPGPPPPLDPGDSHESGNETP